MRSTPRQGGAGARVLVLGLAYKKNVDDPRESPSIELMELLKRRGHGRLFGSAHPGVSAHEKTLLVARASRSPRKRWQVRLPAHRDHHDQFDYGLIGARELIVDHPALPDPAPNSSVRSDGANDDVGRAGRCGGSGQSHRRDLHRRRLQGETGRRRMGLLLQRMGTPASFMAVKRSRRTTAWS